MTAHRLIVGLGNPGVKYAHTRHNMGYLVLQSIAMQWGWSFKRVREVLGQVATGMIGETLRVHLLLPETYMNESGRAVKRYLDVYQLTPSQLIVVSDDVALDFGVLRMRSSGGTGGHNGLKSVQQCCQTQDFVRLRMGIGRPCEGKDLVEYVLGGFSPEEQERLPSFLQQGVEVLNKELQTTR